MLDSIIIPNRLLPIFKPRLHRAIVEAQSLAMISRNRMQNLHRLLYRVDRDGVRGDILEAGVAKGGSVVFLARIVEDSAVERHVRAYDGFEAFGQECAAVYDDVRATIYERFGFTQNQVTITPGLFEETIAVYEAGPIALCHIDASNYQGVKVCLDHLSPWVEPRGWFIIDNYGSHEGCREAVNEWLAAQGLTHALRPFGHTQAYFQQPADRAHTKAPTTP